MGTWGSGNLENDYVWDELDDRSAKLINALMKRARRKTSREGDEYDYTTLFAEFEIVFALEARKLISGHLLPTPEAVEALKWDFIRDWDASIDALQPTESHKKDRRRCILQTFGRFKRICAKYKAKGSG
jgi:hypothetical protein